MEIRYIRDWANGSDYETAQGPKVDNYSKWLELQAFSNGENVALGKTVGFVGWFQGSDTSQRVVDGIYTEKFENHTVYADSVAPGPVAVVVDLGGIFDVQEIKVWKYSPIEPRTYRDTKTEVSTDGIYWITVFDSAIEGTYVETPEGHSIAVSVEVPPVEPPKKGVQVRYIRDWLNGSNINIDSHWIEIKAISDGVNVALGKPTTSNVTTIHRPIEYVTDGETTNSSNYFFGQGVTPPFYAQVDLGAVYELNEIIIYHYYFDGRVYRDNKTEISTDGINWTTVFDSAISGEYAETPQGRSILLVGEETADSISLTLSQEIVTSDVARLALVQEVGASENISVEMTQTIARSGDVLLELVQDIRSTEGFSLGLAQNIMRSEGISLDFIEAFYREDLFHLDIESALYRTGSDYLHIKQQLYKERADLLSLQQELFRDGGILLNLDQAIQKGELRAWSQSLEQSIYKIDQSVLELEQQTTVSDGIAMSILIQIIKPTLGQVTLSFFIQLIDYSNTPPIVGEINLTGARDLFVYLKGAAHLVLELKGGIDLTNTDQDFSMMSGDTKYINITIDEPINLDGVSLKWGVRKNRKASESLFVKTLTDGITIEGSEISVKLEPGDTQLLTGDYYHEMELTDLFGNVSTILVGKMKIDQSGV